MQFIIKRDVLLKSLTLVQGIIEKKNTLPILSNVLLDAKNGKLSIIATDLDLVFYDEVSEIQIDKEGSTTTSAAILYLILKLPYFLYTELLTKNVRWGGHHPLENVPRIKLLDFQ